MGRVSGRVEHTVDDPWNYFVPLPDKGAGLPVAGRVDATLKRLISEVIQSGQTKFRVESDLVRAALHWFITDKFKKFHEGRLDQNVRILVSRVDKAQALAAAYDLKRFKDANRDAILRMWAMDAQGEAIAFFGSMLDEARQIHHLFYKNVQAWAMTDPALDEVRLAWRRKQRELEDEDLDEDGDRRVSKKGGDKGDRRNVPNGKRGAR